MTAATVFIVLLALALVVSLAFNFGFLGGAKAAAPSAQAAANLPASAKTEPRTDDERARKAEAELERKRKELEEVKKAHGETKDELKAAKKKLHEHKEAGKEGDDLVKARAEVERHASVQLENTRHELSNALLEVQKLRSELESRGKKKAAPAPAEAVEKKEEPKPQEVVTRVIRELSDVEKERITRLEAQSSSDRKKAAELDREVRALKAKLDRYQRDSKRVYAEANLARDKFRAVEIRLNRTLTENELTRRALFELQKKTGAPLEPVVMNPEQLAESDRAIKAKHAAEDAAEAEARARLEAAPAAAPEEAPAEAAPASAEASPAPAAQA